MLPMSQAAYSLDQKFHLAFTHARVGLYVILIVGQYLEINK
jgi:hypothetical protein